MPDPIDVQSLMVEECVSEYMTKMEQRHECVRHLAFQAAPSTSVAQLSDVCDAMNRAFKVEDARELCVALNDVHARFWPRFSSP